MQPRSSPGALAASLKQHAAALGLDPVGIAPATPSGQVTYYAGWVTAGHAADLHYLTRPDATVRRADLTTSLPGARTAVVAALNYAQPPADDRPRGDGVPRGRLARYARHRDYHDVLLARLLALGDSLEAAAGTPVARRAYVDTGPLLERELAARAGLGWQGKHTCLIHPRRGSYLLLGVLLLALDLPPDPPFTADRCGTCTRCLDACPTGALPAPRLLDAGRCISYLTIERKGAIPPAWRTAIGDHVFGCDICQEVCPWNHRFAVPTADPDLRPPADDDRAAPDLAALLALDDAAFRERFRGSPVKRAKRRGLLRNAAICLGNAGDPAAVPALVGALRDPEPLVRGHAAWALGQLGRHPAAREAVLAALVAARAVEPDGDAMAEMAAAILTVQGFAQESGDDDAVTPQPDPRDVPEPPPGPGIRD